MANVTLWIGEDGWINKKCYEEARYTSAEHFRAVKIHDADCVTQRVPESSTLVAARKRLFFERRISTIH